MGVYAIIEREEIALLLMLNLTFFNDRNRFAIFLQDLLRNSVSEKRPSNWQYTNCAPCLNVFSLKPKLVKKTLVKSKVQVLFVVWYQSVAQK